MVKPMLLPIMTTKEEIFYVDEIVRDLDITFSQMKKAFETPQAKHK